ncbi:hypothetical protein Fmac_006792 [Flemingia macrophylla]|uniref:Uncharacterized protein n=1 Tax=Flemingia macrophylla TaxID=520843 RepID=A0ABD1NBM3_9FABA
MNKGSNSCEKELRAVDNTNTLRSHEARYKKEDGRRQIVRNLRKKAAMVKGMHGAMLSFIVHMACAAVLSQ